MQCKMTKTLDKEGVDYQEINIDERPDMIDYVKTLASLLRQSLKQVTLFFWLSTCKIKRNYLNLLLLKLERSYHASINERWYLTL